MREASPPDRTQSFDDFVLARGRALWGTAWHLTHDAARAEDLVQSALLKSYPKFDRVSARGSFEAYVRRVIFTTYLASAERREVWRELDDDTHAARPGPDVDVRRDVVRAMAALPPGQRAVVVLRYLEDLSEAQTAEALGCSVGNVKSQLSRALAALRRSGLLDVEG